MIIDGKNIAEKIKEEIRTLQGATDTVSLAIVYAGDNPVIEKYIDMKKRVGAELGIDVEVKRFPGDVSERDLIAAIQEASRAYSGIIVQLPLPVDLDRESIMNAVPPEKDVDMLSSLAFEMFLKEETKRLPPVVFAVREMMREHGVSLAGKNIVVVGRGALVGRPVSAWLAREGIVHQTIDKNTKNNKEILRDADVIISGVGEPHFIQPEMVKAGIVLFDAGTSTSGGKLVGDIDPTCYDKAALASPVPGGIGPLTVVGLFKNLFL